MLSSHICINETCEESAVKVISFDLVQNLGPDVEPKVNKFSLKPEPNEMNNYLILGCMRAWVKINLPLIWGRILG